MPPYEAHLSEERGLSQREEGIFFKKERVQSLTFFEVRSLGTRDRGIFDT